MEAGHPWSESGEHVGMMLCSGYIDGAVEGLGFMTVVGGVVGFIVWQWTRNLP